jgi:hypothetical protein
MKTKAMTCTPGKIWLQLLADSYQRMHAGRTLAANWAARIVTCRECGKDMRVGPLCCHLANLHKIYQGQVVAKELHNWREGVVYEVKEGHGKLKCPFPLCTGKLTGVWMMQQQFHDLQPLNYITIPKEGRYPWCPLCGMQVDLQYPAHINTKECQVGTEQHHQQDMAVCSALALRQQFTVHGDVLEKVKVYQYLHCLLLQDDNDIQAVRSQLCKARGTWARVRQVLHKENAPPRTSAKFYKAIVQSVLLYGSKMWVPSKAVMARLEGFHICTVYRMAKEHVPCRGPYRQWNYPPSNKVLKECGMHIIQHYTDVWRQTITRYTVDCSIFAECKEADQRRSLMPRWWWWEQRMCLDNI